MLKTFTRTSAPDVEWAAYGADTRNTKYSQSAEITAGNAKELQVVWRWSSPDNEIVTAQAGLHLNLFSLLS